MSDQQHWRWFADITWHYFCSMQYEAACAKEANNDFMRYHHLRSCIYFAIGTIESFLNTEMRKHKESENVPEEEIYKILKSTSLDEKRKKWPSVFCKKEIEFSEDIVEIFNAYKEIRNEITHPKLKDHSIYLDLDQADPANLVDAVARALVTMYEGLGTPFPYWVLGWNYVGLNGDPSRPLLGNNINNFVSSFRRMGFSGRGLDLPNLSWDKMYMKDMADYDALIEALNKYPYDTEPAWPGFPLKPLLTKRWWDSQATKPDQKIISQ